MWKNFEKSIGRGPDEKIARQAMDEGNALFRAKKYAEALEKFYIASWRWPDSPLEEDAMFLMAESYFFDDQYGKAQDEYDLLLKANTNTRYLDTIVWRLFAIGRYWEQLDAADPHWTTTPNFTDKKQPWFDTWGNACAAYEAIHIHDPHGPLSDSAEMAVANMYFHAATTKKPARTTTSSARITRRANTSCRRTCWACRARCGCTRGRPTTRRR